MTALMLFALGIVLVVALYYVKIRAQTAQKNILAIQKSMESELAAIKVLEAEIAILESPDRLMSLTREQLGLEPVKVTQIYKVEDLEGLFEGEGSK